MILIRHKLLSVALLCLFLLVNCGDKDRYTNEFEKYMRDFHLVPTSDNSVKKLIVFNASCFDCLGNSNLDKLLNVQIKEHIGFVIVSQFPNNEIDLLAEELSKQHIVFIDTLGVAFGYELNLTKFLLIQYGSRGEIELYESYNSISDELIESWLTSDEIN